ncbi:MAG: hypothetical protein ACXVA9_09375 [Bdellovibrionales bacterium]
MGQLLKILIFIPLFSGCTVARMGVNGSPSSIFGLGGPGGSGKVTENFNSGPSQRKVDILFVDDNSASMDPLQTSLGDRFPAFSTAVQGLDWQIGITTTDCSNGPYGICGSLLSLTGISDTILTSATPNFDQTFKDSIVRPETIGCIARGDCPSGISEPLKAAMTSFDKRTTANARFFRAGASLAIIMLTNADERNDGTGGPTTPQAVYNHFRSIWGSTKDLKAYAIDVVPGDSACLASSTASSVGQVFYGQGPSDFAMLTGGMSESLCATDFSPLLQQIGGDLQSVPNIITLAHTPMPATVVVTLSPDPKIAWTLSGNTIVFAKALPVNTQISVSYEY